ncbi:hypothetical protein [Streptomyces sp. NPDC096324]
MDRLQHLNLGWLYVALIAAGAIGGALGAALSLLADRKPGRRT